MINEHGSHAAIEAAKKLSNISQEICFIEDGKQVKKVTRVTAGNGCYVFLSSRGRIIMPTKIQRTFEDEKDAYKSLVEQLKKELLKTKSEHTSSKVNLEESIVILEEADSRFTHIANSVLKGGRVSDAFTLQDLHRIQKTKKRIGSFVATTAPELPF